VDTGQVESNPTEAPTPEDIETAELEQKILLSTNNAALDEQLEQRPLAKKQEELEGAVVQETNNSSSEQPSSENQPSASEQTAESDISTSTHHPEKPKQALLKNDDVELDRIGKVCLMWEFIITSQADCP
jgi:RNA polymerase II subunit A-like phosphatase